MATLYFDFEGSELFASPWSQWGTSPRTGWSSWSWWWQWRHSRPWAPRHPWWVNGQFIYCHFCQEINYMERIWIFSQIVVMSLCIYVWLFHPSEIYFAASHWPWDYMISFQASHLPGVPPSQGFLPVWLANLDWFVGGNFRLHALFFGKSYRENKNWWENTPKKL